MSETEHKKRGPKRIQDRFTDLLKKDGTPASRQQIHMMRKRAQGICLKCADRAVGVYCLKHMVDARERMRHARDAKRRLKSSLSYKLQSKKKQ